MAESASRNAKKAASKGVPEPADVEAGLRLRMRRIELNFPQKKLAEHANVSFQQIQKYEKGINRISPSKLEKFAQLLEVNPGYFFASSDRGHTVSGFSSGEQAALTDQSKGGKGIGADVFQRQETFELIRAYYTITDAKQRRKVLETVRAMASLADK